MHIDTYRNARLPGGGLYAISDGPRTDLLTVCEAVLRGGAVLLPENRRMLAERGRVVYLKTSIAQQVERVRQGRSRPLLAEVDPAAKLGELMELRAPLYAEIADITVTTDNRKVRNVAEDVLRELDAAELAR